MNIFYLDHNPESCAQMHVDKHTIKMILEYSQLLSTAHRVLDGTITIGISEKTKRKITRYDINDPTRNNILYAATHINHPSAIWVRQSATNYKWLHRLLVALCQEYSYRYGKMHKCQSIGLVDALSTLPDNIPNGEFTYPTPAMPTDCIVVGNSVQSYRNYYKMKKEHLWSWAGKVNGRDKPEWLSL